MLTCKAHSEQTEPIPVLDKEVNQMERCLVCSSDCKMKGSLPELLQRTGKYKQAVTHPTLSRAVSFTLLPQVIINRPPPLSDCPDLDGALGVLQPHYNNQSSLKRTVHIPLDPMMSVQPHLSRLQQWFHELHAFCIDLDECK